MRIAGWLFALVMTGIAWPAWGQANEPHRYQQFEFDPRFVVKDRLQMEKQLGPFKDLIKKIAADPNKMPIDPGKFKNLKFDDDLKKAIQDWAANDPALRDALKDWIKKNPNNKDVKLFQDDLKKILDRPKPTDAVEPLQPNAEPPKPKPDALTRVTEEALKRAEHSRLGEMLRDSPAWNRAFEDLRASLNHPQGQWGNLDGWPDRLRWPSDLDGMRRVPMPDFADWMPSLPGFWDMVDPDSEVLESPAEPSLPSAGTVATWILLGAFSLLIAWQLMRLTNRVSADADRRTALGPWPVRPELVATRAELVQAFDYLALLTLGFEVRSWNHHAVAQCWRDLSAGCVEPAAALALLYEQARYTTGPETLTQNERELARRSLAQLAEAL